MLFGALWLAATAATGAVAWGAVRLAGEQTAEQAVHPMTVRQVEALASGTTAMATTTSTRPAPASTSSTGPASTTTTTSATTTAAPATSTSTSTTDGAPILAARQTRGGTVVVSLQGGRLSLVSATPAPGYSVEIVESGPDVVVVAFEGAEDDEVRVRAFVSSGGVEFSVDSGEEQD